MKKPEGAPVQFYWPGGEPLPDPGEFHDTGNTYPSTYGLFFGRYNNGRILILPGSTVGGGQGVRAQVATEGHSEVTLSACLMRAKEDPNNPWGITDEDMSPANVNLTLIDFGAIYGKQGLRDAMRLYGSGHGPSEPLPPPGNQGAEARVLRAEVERLTKEAGEHKIALESARQKLAEAIKAREDAQKAELLTRGRVTSLLSELDARARGMRTAAGAKGGGKYAQALRDAAEGLEKFVAAYREKAGA